MFYIILKVFENSCVALQNRNDRAVDALFGDWLLYLFVVKTVGLLWELLTRDHVLIKYWVCLFLEYWSELLLLVVLESTMSNCKHVCFLLKYKILSFRSETISLFFHKSIISNYFGNFLSNCMPNILISSFSSLRICCIICFQTL